MLMNSKALALFVLPALIGAGALAPSAADAKFRRRSAHACTTTDAFVTSDQYGITNVRSGYVWLRCDLEDDTELPKESIRTLNVHLYQAYGNANSSARVCVSYWNVLGGACDMWAATPVYTSGMFTLHPPVDVLADAGGAFPYLEVQYPGAGVFKGYYITD
jgi:hypothetical protein